MFITLASYLTTYLFGVIGVINQQPFLIDRYLYPMFFIYLFLILMSLSVLNINKYVKYPLYVIILGLAIFVLPTRVTKGAKFEQITFQNALTKQQVGSKVLSLNNYGTTDKIISMAAKNSKYIYWIPRIKYQYASNFV